MHVVIVYCRRAVGPWVLFECVVVNAKESIRASNRRKRNPSGDVVELDERISSLVIDVAEDGEENWHPKVLSRGNHQASQ